MPSKRLADVLADESGFTWMELLIASAILALLVAIMLPSYLGARNAAAIAEGNTMAKEWAALEYSCYQQNTFPSLVTTTGINCFTNTAIGFTEPNGKFWRFTTGTGTSPYIQSASTTASGLGDGDGFVSLHERGPGERGNLHRHRVPHRVDAGHRDHDVHPEGMLRTAATRAPDRAGRNSGAVDPNIAGWRPVLAAPSATDPDCGSAGGRPGERCDPMRPDTVPRQP